MQVCAVVLFSSPRLACAKCTPPLLTTRECRERMQRNLRARCCWDAGPCAPFGSPRRSGSCRTTPQPSAAGTPHRQRCAIMAHPREHISTCQQDRTSARVRDSRRDADDVSNRRVMWNEKPSLSDSPICTSTTSTARSPVSGACHDPLAPRETRHLRVHVRGVRVLPCAAGADDSHTRHVDHITSRRGLACVQDNHRLPKAALGLHLKKRVCKVLVRQLRRVLQHAT